MHRVLKRYRHWRPAPAGHGLDLRASQVKGHRTPALASRIPHGLCGLPRADWHDLWINHWHGLPDIQFEWQNGPAHATALDRLLDPEFGPGAELEFLDGQSAQDCYSDMAGRVRVRGSGDPRDRVVLRRLLSPDSGATTGTLDLGAGRLTQRDAIERPHGYRTHR